MCRPRGFTTADHARVPPPVVLNPNAHRCHPIIHPQPRGNKSDEGDLFEGTSGDAAAAADAGFAAAAAAACEDEWEDDDPEEIQIDESEVCVS